MWLTQMEAAARAGVSDRTIRRWVAWGEIKPRYFDGKFREADVVETEKRMRARRGRRRSS